VRARPTMNPQDLAEAGSLPERSRNALSWPRMSALRKQYTANFAGVRR